MAKLITFSRHTIEIQPSFPQISSHTANIHIDWVSGVTVEISECDLRIDTATGCGKYHSSFRRDGCSGYIMRSQMQKKKYTEIEQFNLSIRSAIGHQALSAS